MITKLMRIVIIMNHFMCKQLNMINKIKDLIIKI